MKFSRRSDDVDGRARFADAELSLAEIVAGWLRVRWGTGNVDGDAIQSTEIGAAQHIAHDSSALATTRDVRLMNANCLKPPWQEYICTFIDFNLTQQSSPHTCAREHIR